MECIKCQALTQVIDELSDLLAREQGRRLEIFRENVKLKRLLVIDMEDLHALTEGPNFVNNT
jgi:hypothetical protein